MIKKIFSFFFTFFIFHSCQQKEITQKFKNNYKVIFERKKIEVNEVVKAVKDSNSALPEIWNFIEIKLSENKNTTIAFENIYKDKINSINTQKINNNLVVFIWIGGAGSGNYGEVLSFILKKDTIQLVEMPFIENSELKNLYSGHDSYSFGKGKIYREFPIYKNNDSECCPTGGKVKLVYLFNNANIKMIKFDIIK